MRQADIEHPVVVEDFGQGITAKTQVQATRIVYQVLINDAVHWQRVVEIASTKGNQDLRRRTAMTQDGLARSLVDERRKG